MKCLVQVVDVDKIWNEVQVAKYKVKRWEVWSKVIKKGEAGSDL